MSRRRLIAGGIAALSALSLIALPTLQARGASNDLKVGIPTVVDPIRGGAEPYISVDRNNQPFVSAPGGTSVQTSWYWRSRDQGLTYQLLGPSAGHWICNTTGGGDSSQVYDHLSDTMYLMDQQALVDVASGQFNATTGKLTAHKCFADPGVGADRPFEAVLHPNGAVKPLQWQQDGHKPMVYMSWQCAGCAGGNPVQSGGLAFAWSYDGVNWHAADPGVPTDNLVAQQFFEAGSITNYSFHGPMVTDPQTGYVFTAIACAPGACPVSTTKNEFGVAVGKPGVNRTDPTNVGQFASLTYQTAANSVNGQPIKEQGSLFPVIAMDKAGTLYEAWIEGNGSADPAVAPEAQAWHLYYTYSKDRPNHTQWAPVKRVDLDGPTKTNAFGWMTAGDKGKLGFVWLGTDVRESPSKHNDAKKWYPQMSVVTDADTANPTFHQARVGRTPMHISDICLRGTVCAVPLPNDPQLGNRNMADFISLDIGPDGALTATYAADSNRIAPKPTDTVPGVPMTMTVHQTGGPRLIGSGNVSDRRFSTALTSSIGDAVGDGRYPVPSGGNRSQLDLRGVKITHTSTGLDVTIDVSSLAKTNSPALLQPNVWYLVTWVDKNAKIWFARAESDSGGAITYSAGAPGAYDRPGIMIGTVPTLVDYRGGTGITGSHTGSSIVMHVPAGVVGSPQSNDVLESVTGWSILDNGVPPFDTAALGNVPTIVDATAAFDAGMSPTSSRGAGNGGNGGRLATTGGPGAAFGGIALALTIGAVLLRRRRRVNP